MCEPYTLNLVFGTKTFTLSNNETVSLLNPDIIKSFQAKKEYKIRSNVSNEVFESFFNYLLFKRIPNLNFDNISQYEQLSDEFDYMKNLIKIFKTNSDKKDILFLSFLNQKLTKKINKKSDNLKSKTTIFKQNIKFLFNMKKYETFSQIKTEERYIINICLYETIDQFTRENCEENGLVYSINEEEKTACLYKTTIKNGEFCIPGSIQYKSEKYKVTGIHQDTFQYMDCKSLKFDENHSKIFILKEGFDLYNLESITIPSDIETFTERWCERTVKLNNITIIPKKKQNIILYDNKFILGKSDLQSNTFDILYFARRDVENVTIPSYISKIASNAFYSCNHIKKVEFEANSQLTMIDDYAFYESSVVDINIPSKVKRIGIGAFASFCKIKNVVFSNDSEIEIIDDYAFNSYFLETIKIPSSIKNLGKYWCKSGSNIPNVIIMANHIENIKWFNNDFILGKTNQNSDVFDILLLANPKIEKAIIPSFVRIVYYNAFYGCKMLKSVEFSSHTRIKIIESDAFSLCDFERITIPSSVCKIGGKCFWKCEQLKTVEFENDSQLENIEHYTFSYCPIESIKIPSHVKSIGKSAFIKCKKLKSIEFCEQSELRLIDDYAFEYSSIERISIPPHVIKIGERAFNETRYLRNVEFSHDSELKIIGKYAFVCSPIRRITIPSHVTKIKMHTFWDCSSLIAVEFGKNSELKIIGNAAFCFCNFESITIPDHVIEIKKNAFQNIKRLKCVDFSDNSELKIIEEHAFSKTSIKSIIIPMSIRKIDRTAFNGSKIQILELNERFNRLSAYSLKSEIVSYPNQ